MVKYCTIMYMKFRAPSRQLRKERTRKLYVEWAKLFNEGVPVQDIADKTINSKTGKPYTRGQVYNALKSLQDEIL